MGEVLRLHRLVPVHSVPGRVRFRFVVAGQGGSGRLAEAAQQLHGVLEARLNERAGSLALRYDPAHTDPQRLTHELLALRLSTQMRERPAKADGPSALGVGVSLAGLVGNSLMPMSARTPATLMAALPVMAQGAQELVKRGVTSHVLESLAVGISAVRGDHTAANVTIFMLALGEYLEESIAHRSDDLLKGLLRPVSSEVWVERDGQEVLIEASAVRVGDVVVVGVGAVVPVDGTVLDGEALLNEAAMTGESVPVRRQRGDRVLSGTFLEEGRLRLYAEQVGAHTAVARIADYVEQSLSVKSRTQLEAARLADRLVPLVLGLAGTTWLASGDWRRAASVLQADYSCVLKLATPVAFKSAMYGAGRQGILVKGATALERLSEADTFVFDKTGTLTEGRLEVTDTVAFDPAFSPQELVCLAASIEEHSMHPMAAAVVDACQVNGNRHFDHSEVEFIVAHGVASEVDGKRVVVGSRHFVQDDEGVVIDAAQQATIDALYRKGRTLLFVARDGILLGVLGLKDTIREEAPRMIARLRASGVRRIVLLTGDHRDRGEELARALGLDECHAELLPEDKARILQELSDAGAKVAFVGDGVNDAPALAGAHVGIAMKNGADLARLTADIALLEDDVERVADAKEQAMATMGLIGTNYRLAVGINTAILGGAAMGLLSPIASSVLHNGSTIGILLNALRGRRPARSQRKPLGYCGTVGSGLFQGTGESRPF